MGRLIFSDSTTSCQLLLGSDVVNPEHARLGAFGNSDQGTDAM